MQVVRCLAVSAMMALMPRVAAAYDINGYAVGNHRSCNASNLPGTIAEMDKLFASADFPDDARKNFLWKDARVRLGEWAAANDRFESRETANGFDGADAALISYIASHGVTSSAKYSALAGGANGGCRINNTDMGIGDQASRYLILSTCQGLKIGNGDDPDRTGENPSVTWRSGNVGLNCIFGYSNNMVDSDLYGVNLLHNLATSDDTLTEAFFKASRQISSSNIPAVLCFGVDDADARQHLETAKRFTDERNGQGGSAWRYARSHKAHGAFALPSARVPRQIVVKARGLNHERIARELLGANLSERPAEKGLSVYRSDRGTLTYDAAMGALTWRRDDRTRSTGDAPKDQTAIRIARDFLKVRGLVPSDAELDVSYVVDVVDGGKNGRSGAPSSKIVQFHQKFHDLMPLGAQGSAEVTIQGGGDVVQTSVSLLAAELPRIQEWIEPRGLDLTRHKQEALEEFSREHPEETASIIDSRVGYESIAEGNRLKAVVEVLIEAERGGFARRYLQRVDL